MFLLPSMITISRAYDVAGKVLTLNSFIIGTISSSRAWLVTSPPRRSILFPTRMTGTYERGEPPGHWEI